MASTLLPPTDRDPLWIDGDVPPRPAVDDRDDEPPRAARRRRPRTPVALVAVSALLGGLTSVGVVASTGLVGVDRTTTVVQRSEGGTTVAAASDGGLDAQALYAATLPGVVAITAAGGTTEPFTPPSSGSPTATGTGFVVDEDGLVVTAAHVVDDASRITVAFSDGTTRTADVLGTDDATDVAVLRVDDVDGLDLQPLELGDASALEVGQEVAAIGGPFGYDRSISTGIVSGLDRTIEAPNGFTVAHAIQTDAAVNPGNSGGPLLDAGGRVVGIVDQIATDGSSEQSSGVGFAVSIDVVRAELDELSAGGTVEHAYLGVSMGEADEAGAAIASVVSGGPAADAGLRQGDVVTELDGRRLDDSGDLVAAIAEHEPGDAVELTVTRGSGTETLTVTLGTQPRTAPAG